MPNKSTNAAGVASPTQDQVRDAFQSLYDQLTQAYWAASDIATKDRIYGIEEIVYDALMQLDKQKLAVNSSLYGQVKAQMQNVIAKIDQLKKDIDSIIHAVNVATEVAGAIDKAIALAAKYFGI